MRQDYPRVASARAARAHLSPTKLPTETELLVRRFITPVRQPLRRLIRRSTRYADLATVFPGAAFVLAGKHLSSQRRRFAGELVENGAALKAVARAMDLPYWLRRLPPEAFTAPLPKLPDSESFSRRIATRLPRRRRESAFWLQSLAFAVEAAHDDFALWLSEQPVFDQADDPRELFAVLAAYAWFSREGGARARDLIVVPWRPEVSFDTALCAAKSWFNRIRLVLQLAPGTICDAWMDAGLLNGYRFVPLTDKSSIIEESHAMQNCTDQYADRLVRDKCRLFSVRRGNARVATLEIGPHFRETGVLTVTQLKARHNMPAPVEVWQATYAWLATQSGLKRLPPMKPPERPLDEEAWRELMAPYREKKDGASWIPSTPTEVVFGQHDANLADLARRGGVSSWLFT